MARITTRRRFQRCGSAIEIELLTPWQKFLCHFSTHQSRKLLLVSEDQNSKLHPTMHEPPFINVFDAGQELAKSVRSSATLFNCMRQTNSPHRIPIVKQLSQLLHFPFRYTNILRQIICTEQNNIESAPLPD